MELSHLLIVAALAALLGGAFNSVFMPLAARLSHHPDHTSRKFTLGQQLVGAIVHVCAGAGLGLLFWLSWGLAAVVGISWWVRGISFGLVIWIVICLPLFATQWLTFRMRKATTFIAAIEWLVIVLAVGLACGWSWAKGP
jgi:hypothetical protein